MSKPDAFQRFRKLFIEFLVIVFGVFVALAAETWWSEREDRALERDLRADMVSEFAANIQILEQDIHNNTTSTPFFERLPNLSDEELFSLSDAELNRDYRTYPSWEGFDADMGLAQALVSSGNLISISDHDLRLRLSRWAGLMVEKERKNLQAVNFQTHSLMPAIATVSGDDLWTPAERRTIQTLYYSMAQLRRLVLDNQQQLLKEAQSIHDYLSETQ